jgi:hypothetical protein
LRSLLVRRCSIGAADVSGEIAVDESPLSKMPSNETDGDAAGSPQQGRRLALTLGTLRRLPVFDTLSQRRCVALTSHGVICAPADGDDCWQRSSSWDTELEPVLGDELLRLQDDEEVALLRNAGLPEHAEPTHAPSESMMRRFSGLRIPPRTEMTGTARRPVSELVDFLAVRLRRVELPKRALLLLLSTAGSPKQLRLVSDREGFIRNLSLTPVVVMADNSRRNPGDLIDPSDSLLQKALATEPTASSS